MWLKFLVDLVLLLGFSVCFIFLFLSWPHETLLLLSRAMHLEKNIFSKRKFGVWFILSFFSFVQTLHSYKLVCKSVIPPLIIPWHLWYWFCRKDLLCKASFNIIWICLNIIVWNTQRFVNIDTQMDDFNMSTSYCKSWELSRVCMLPSIYSSHNSVSLPSVWFLCRWTSLNRCINDTFVPFSCHIIFRSRTKVT